MTKLDWKRGYTADPARVRIIEDFSSPDESIVTKGRKRFHSSWEIALRALRKAGKLKAGAGEQIIDQWTLLAALGVKKGALRMQERAAIIKRLCQQGILLPTGQPNPRHPKVIEIATSVAKSTKKAKGRAKAKTNRKS